MTEAVATMGDNNPPETTKDQYINRIDLLEDALHRAPKVIDGDDLAVKATNFIKQCADLNKSAEGERKAEKKPHLAANKEIEANWQGVKARIEDLKAKMSKRLLPYTIKKQEEATELERKRAEQQAANEAEQARRDAEAAKSDEPVFQPPIEKAQTKASINDARKTTTQSGATSSVRRDWKIEIVDKDKIDRKYFVLDEAAILRDVRAAKGDIEVAGVKIESDDKVVVR